VKDKKNYFTHPNSSGKKNNKNNTQKAKAQQIKTYISPHLLLFATSQFKNSEVELV